MNLLSPEQKELIRKDIWLRFYSVLDAVFSFWAIVLIVLVYNVSFYLKIQIPALEARIAQEKISESTKAYRDTELEIEKLNSALTLIDKIRGAGFADLADILRKLSAAVPQGISFNNLSYQGDVITLGGHADTRAEALQFKEVLEKDSVCLSLTSPVIVRETNVNFSFVCNLSRPVQVQAQEGSEESLDNLEEDEL